MHIQATNVKQSRVFVTSLGLCGLRMSTNPLFIMVAASHHILMWFIPLFNVVAAPPHFNVGYSAIQCGCSHYILMWCFPLFNVVLHHTTFPCGISLTQITHDHTTFYYGFSILLSEKYWILMRNYLTPHFEYPSGA